MTRTTHTNLDVLQESRIDDSWNVDVDRKLSDSWTGFKKFTSLNEKIPKGFSGCISEMDIFVSNDTCGFWRSFLGLISGGRLPGCS